MMNPLVSVIIPVYNVEKYLPRCLDSVCKQTYKNLEVVVVVDNNSPDKCPEIIESYAAKDQRIKVCKEKRQGLGAARDKGLDEASGEWICFLDSDDYWHPSFVEIMLQTALQNDCLTVQCRYKEIYGYGNEIDDVSLPQPLLLEWRDYILYTFTHVKEKHSPFGVWSNIWHSSLFEGVRFDGIRAGEDSYISPKLIYGASKKHIAVIDSILYYYCVRDDSLLHGAIGLQWTDHWKAKEGAANFWKDKNEPELYAMFWSIYFNTLVIDYIRFCVNLPDKKSDYEIMYQKIKENLNQARASGNPHLLIHTGAKTMWESISRFDTEYIQYGYGNYGQSIHGVLKNCGFNITEIWDMKASGNSTVAEIPIRKPHPITGRSVTAIITVADEMTNIQIEFDLKKYGITSFIPYRILQPALRYRMYEKYLPFLLSRDE